MSGLARKLPQSQSFGFGIGMVLFAVLAVVFMPVSGVSAATLDVCTSGCTYNTIQSAVNAASSGDTISISAGTYTENVTISGKYVTLDGAGSGAGDTIIESASAGTNVLTIQAGGASENARQVVQNLRITGASNAADSIVISGDHITIANVTVVNTTTTGTGLEVGVVNDLIVTGSTFTGHTNGLRLGTQAVLDGASITNSHFDGNQFGMNVFQATNGSGVLNDLTVTNTTFNNNAQKGIYVEKLSNALFDHITVNNSGTDPAYQYNAGIDINLKYDSYDDIEIRDSVISNSGVTINSSPFPGAAIAVKARDDGSYSSSAATLTNFLMTGVEVINNPAVGIRFGEPSKDNAGPTAPVVTQSRILNNGGDGIVNVAQAHVNAENNWWGCNTGPNTANCETTSNVSSGSIDTDPWLTETSDDDNDDDNDAPVEAPQSTGPVTTYESNAAGTGTSGAITASGNPNVNVTALVVNGEGNLASVGDPNLIGMGVVQAVDVYTYLPGGVLATVFDPPLTVCLQGAGTVYFRPASDQTGTFVPAPAFAGGNGLCVTLSEPGLLVLVGTTTGAPVVQQAAATSSATSTPLTDCEVTTEYILRLRAEPNTSSAILDRLPMSTVVDASETVDGWYKVVYGDQQGWVSGDYVSTSGSCG